MMWNEFDKFDVITEDYLPAYGEGKTMATQATTAVSKLVYKWFNDGDVYDNRYMLKGWLNDLSDYANWLAHHVEGADEILSKISDCDTEDEYEELLYELCEHVLNEDMLKMLSVHSKEGSVYNCKGDFVFEEYDDEEDNEDYYYEWEDEDEDEDEDE